MKKLNYLIIGAAALAMASCSQDEVVAPAGDGNVNFVVNLPGDLATRALGDGLSSNVLQYAVYEVESTGATPTYSYSGVADFGGKLSTTLSLNLINGKTYQIAFFAQSEASKGNVYTFNGKERTMTVDYSAMNSDDNNADAYDCFYKVTEQLAVTAATSSYNVTLQRPVAQINWGANDIDANDDVSAVFGKNGEYVRTKLTVSQPGVSLNLLTGEVANAAGNVTIGGEDGFAIPTGTAYPVSGYQYIAVQYVLVPTTSTISSFTLNVSNAGNTGASSFENVVDVANAPVQANYRTNIYGALLTNSSDFDIDKGEWGGSEDVPAAWDGTTVTKPMVVGNNVNISKPSDLAGLAAMVNGDDINGESQTATDFAGKTITINADLDLNGEEFPMIGSATRSSGNLSASNPFRGTFDGQGHTISNIKVSYDGDDANTAVGIFANVDGTGVVKNVTFKDVNIEGGAARQAGVVGIITNGGTVSGVTVESGSVSATESAGGIAGRMLKKGTVQDCNNYATIHSNGNNGGGIVGAATYTENGSTMTISGCNNYGKVSGLGSSIGGIVGTSAANVENCVNNGEVECNDNTIGGIVAYQVMAGSVKGCTNNAYVNGGTYVGGIIGRVAYGLGYGPGKSYEATSRIEVSGNTNKGNITGANEVAGIVGRFAGTGICINNTNNAASLTSSNTSATGLAAIIANSMPANVDGLNTNTIEVSNNQNTTSGIERLYGGTTSEYTTN